MGRICKCKQLFCTVRNSLFHYCNKHRFFRAVNCQILGDVRTEALVEIYNSNLPSLHFEIAKPTNLNCQSPKEGLWDVSVKQIELFEDNPDTGPDAVGDETEPGSSENSDIE